MCAKFLLLIHSLTKKVINVLEKLVLLIELQFLELGTNVSNYCLIFGDFPGTLYNISHLIAFYLGACKLHFNHNSCRG